MAVRLSGKDLWTSKQQVEARSTLQEARNLHSETKRRGAISKYYVEKAGVDLSAKAKPDVEKMEPLPLTPGSIVIHPVFGKGTVTGSSVYYLFVRFESDDMDRKFNPGDAVEFTKA